MRKKYKLKILCFYLAVTFMVTCWPDAHAFGQENHKILIVKTKSRGPYDLAVKGFRYQCPKNWSVSEFDLGGTLKNLDQMAQKIEQTQPELILAVGSPAVVALNRAKVRQPIVYCAAMNVEDYDLSECDITGAALRASAKVQLETLTNLNPKIKKIAVLCKTKSEMTLLRQAQRAAEKYKVELLPVKIANENEIPKKIRPLLGQVDAIWALDDAYIHSKETLEFITLKAIENNVAFMAISEAFVKEGALLSVAPTFFHNGKDAATLAKRILADKLQAGNVDVALCQDPELAINTKIAKEIGLDIPAEILDRAGKVY